MKADDNKVPAESFMISSREISWTGALMTSKFKLHASSLAGDDSIERCPEAVDRWGDAELTDLWLGTQNPAVKSH